MFLLDYDECANGSDECGDTATCTNTIGSYNCTCKAGFDDSTGDGKHCIDIDECKTGDYVPCPEGYVCYNRPGYSTCVLATPAPTPSPTTSFPSSSPSGIETCSRPGPSAAGNWCGVETTDFGCSCDNTCAAMGNCCWEFQRACTEYIDNAATPVFAASTVDVQYVPSGGSEVFDVSAFLRCDDLFLGRGASTKGCGFSLSFSTLAASSITCECLTIEMRQPLYGSVVVYYNGITSLELSGFIPSQTYSLDCSMFGGR